MMMIYHDPFFFFFYHVLSISLYIFRALRNSVSDRMVYLLNGDVHGI